MSLSKDSIFENVFNNELIIEFSQVTLIQKTKSNPKIYKGMGSIKQNLEGELQLSIDLLSENHESYWAEFADIFAPEELIAGKILPEDNYYRMEGLDLESKVWTADDINLKKILDDGKIIIKSTHLMKIKSKHKSEAVFEPSISLMIPHPLRIPFNKKQDASLEKGLSACILKINESISIFLKKKGNFLLIDIESSHQEINSVKQRILEAAGIATGVHLLAQVEIKKQDKETEYSIRSLKEKTIRSRHLSTPISMQYRIDFINFEFFIKRYLLSFDLPYSEMCGYWFRFLLSSSDSLENQALVITTAIEGVLKKYFSEFSSPDEEYKYQIEDAKKIIENIDLGERARSHIANSLGYACQPTASNALRSLKEQGLIPNEFLKSWRDLRNKVSHADELKWNKEKSQSFIDDLFVCHELFYRLIMIHIGYDREITCFSRNGWPNENINDFKNATNQE